MPKRPAPFKRPSIDLTRPTRRWQTVMAETLDPDDIVADLGKVVKVIGTRHDITTVDFIGGRTEFIDATKPIFAFTRERDGNRQ